MSPAFPPSSSTIYMCIYSVFLAVVSKLPIPQILTTHIYGLSSIEHCKKYFKTLKVEKIKAHELFKEGGLPLSCQTYCTALFSANEAQELWCPELFQRKGPPLEESFRQRHP